MAHCCHFEKGDWLLYLVKALVEIYLHLSSSDPKKREAMRNMNELDDSAGGELNSAALSAAPLVDGEMLLDQARYDRTPYERSCGRGCVRNTRNGTGLHHGELDSTG